MRFYWCLVASAIIHLLAVQCCNWLSDAAPVRAGGQLLTVRLANKSRLIPENLVQSGLPVQELKSDSSAQEKSNQHIHLERSVDTRVISQSPRESKESLYHGFLPTSELDRKAEPISNINLDMMQGFTSSGLNIKLRLYINEYGHVVHVEELVVLEQDREFKDKLVELLYDLTFLPAKKNGVDVDSYQDVSLSFNSLLDQPLGPSSE